jgi:hypothetical protein
MIDLRCTCNFGFSDGPESVKHKPGCPIGDWFAGRPAKEELSPIAQFGATQLANLWTETLDRLARTGHFDSENLVIATAEEVLRKLEAAGQDEPLNMLISKHEEKIRIDFTKRIGTFSMDKDHAVNFALTILQHCGVPVNITLNPPPANSGDPV